MLRGRLVKSLVLWVAWVTRAAAATNDSSAYQCNNKCQLNDETSDCWKNSQKYFFRQFVKGIHDYLSFESMLKFWNEKHGHSVNTNDREVLAKEILPDVPGPLNVDDFISILEMLNNKTEKYSEDNGFEISCPTPCDYINTLWIYLFVCACIVILLIVPVMFMHVYFNRRSFSKYQLS